MNILLVDDDVDVIEGIIDAIDFKSLGFNMVYVAHDADRAMSILKTSPIEIMITDIEMPGESGIDLLKWVRDHKMPIVGIICTCFASFDYAKKAVELQSFDYFLKPISYSELSGIIKLAIEESKKLQALEHYQKYIDSFHLHREDERGKFWKEILDGRSFDEASSIYSDAELEINGDFVFIAIYA